MRFVFSLFFIPFFSLFAATLNVGEGQTYKDLTAAINKSQPGDVILLHEGTYELSSEDGVNFPQLKSGVTLKGTNKFQVVVKPKGDNPTYQALFKIIDKKDISIENLTIYSPHGNIYIKDSDNITIQNCILQGFRWSARRKMALYVDKGSTFGGSSGLLLTHILFDSCNPVYLGAGNKGTFADNCLHKVENTNYWQLSNSSSWEYQDIIHHKTILKKPHHNADYVHNLNRELDWLDKHEGLKWGAVKKEWVYIGPRKDKAKPTNASDSFLESLANSGEAGEPISIDIEIERVEVKDVQGPEIYLEERAKGNVDFLKGRVSDLSGIAKLTVYEKSARLVNGKNELRHTHQVELTNGAFAVELELDDDNTLVTVEAVDKLGNSSSSFQLVTKREDSKEIHLFQEKRAESIIQFSVPEVVEEPFLLIRGYVNSPEKIANIFVKGIPATIDERGNFSAVVPLAAGDNEIEIVANDNKGERQKKYFEVKARFEKAPVDRDKPVIELEKTRSKSENELLRGKIVDASSIPFFAINGVKVELDEKGMFSHKVTLTPTENVITLRAYDAAGNWTSKEIKRSGKEVYQSIVRDSEYYALVIGINNYDYMPNLKTALNDAVAVAEVLEKKYGFNVTLLKNAARRNIIKKMNDFAKILKPDDKFLIYYAGHGYFHDKKNTAYWLPMNAEEDDPSFWISADDITDSLLSNAAKSILVVSDSCFSGAISGKRYRSGEAAGSKGSEVKNKFQRPCRLLLSSGGNEPVVDGNNDHSVFAEAFLWTLENPPSDIFSVADIYPDIYETVRGGDTSQKPDLGFIKESGHAAGGGFIFVRKQK